MRVSKLFGGARTMPFTFTIRLDEEFCEGLELDCAGEVAAIDAAKEVLQARIGARPPGAGSRRGVVGVGVGSLITAPDRVLWLGEWEWCAEEGWGWTSSD